MITTQLNITFISYFVKKINCISVFHRFFSKSVYVVDARVYVCVCYILSCELLLRFRPGGRAYIPSRSSKLVLERSRAGSTHKHTPAILSATLNI